jgi:hypothetical protein
MFRKQDRTRQPLGLQVIMINLRFLQRRPGTGTQSAGFLIDKSRSAGINHPFDWVVYVFGHRGPF